MTVRHGPWLIGRTMWRTAHAAAAAALFIVASSACGGAPRQPRARNLLLITIDTLRADRVGAYGYTRARTPRLDALARSGAVFERAYAAAPITLPSHATILSGRYPPGHGARDNGMKVSPATPTLATILKAQGFRTAAFVAAFPLDHQFGLDRGFDVYGDRLPRDRMGRPTNERSAADVVNDATAWLRSQPEPSGAQPSGPVFLWTHFFEPHAPYEGDPSRPVADRYDEEVATVDREIGRLLDAFGDRLHDTLVVAAGDHGEAFGEHGEYAHSIFVYDTTLRVPLIIAGPGIGARRIRDATTLADIAPTVGRQLGIGIKDVDGADLSRAMAGEAIAVRELYAESFAPLLEFGWAPLRAVRSGSWKFVAAPRPELYDVDRDAAEARNVVGANADVARGLDLRVSRYSTDAPPNLGLGGAGSNATGPDAAAADRLRALGYAAGSRSGGDPSAGPRPDPKDRRELAARIAQVTSGELQGAALVAALEGIVRDDPRNGQAHLRLGYARMQAGDCTGAEPEFHAAVEAGLPSADAHLGLAGCLGRRNDLAGAERALNEARRLEPGNPVILANIGILKATQGDMRGAVAALASAIAADPDMLEARFNLAVAYARAGQTAQAEAEAREVLRRLPPGAPQRSEIERLLAAIKPK
jgi:arylsulfatase A-like enzyme/cytochrome c-type biogenesis protein CcmH/NrfG